MIKYLVLFFCPLLTFAQGKLVLVGGGAEEIGGWSDEPYRRIVQQADNKRVAVISYTDETDFIPNYFLMLGASAAINIKIDSKSLADLQTTYDSLMAFDAFFFKGGDQSYYYNYFKDTKTQKAIIDKFNDGGVLSGTSAGMSILSGVIFTALHDSVYPDDMLANFKNSSVTLANDFLPVFPGYLFDTHFTERGRGARLIGFMTNWFLKNGELLTGIGVDDRTAFCVDSNLQGSVFGTGTVSIYSAASFSSYQATKPIADSIHVTQLLHGNIFNLADKTIVNGPAKNLRPTFNNENGNYRVMLSGGEGVSQNAAFLNEFVVLDNPSDTIIIVTAVGKARSYVDLLTTKGARSILIETSSASNDASQFDLRNNIRRSKKILFAENDDDALFNFLQSGATGELIAGHLKRNNMITGFIGEDSRYAGKKVVTNHLQDLYNAYYGKLQYRAGLGLLSTSIVMPNTYDLSTSDHYENTTAAVPYSMIKDSLAYGIYLERESYLKFYQQSGINYFVASGSLSTIVITQNNTMADFESQPVNASGDVRNYVGFAEMKYTLLNGPGKMKVGVPHLTQDAPYEMEYPTGLSFTPEKVILPFPNPSKTGTFYLPQDGSSEKILQIGVTDVLGRIVLEEKMDADENFLPIDLSEMPDGIYFLSWFTWSAKFGALIYKGG